MTLGEAFDRLFRPTKRDAAIALTEIEHVAVVALAELELTAESIIHQAEKELAMIPQPIQDLIDRIKTALATHSNQGAADAQTISDLRAANAAKDAQIAQLTSDGQAKDDQIATLTQELADTQAALQAIADQVPAPAPTPAQAPADGSGSADVQP